MKRKLSRIVAGIVIGAVVLGCGRQDGSKEFELGKAAYEVRDLKRAEKLFEKCVGLTPGDVDRVLLLARVKFDLGDLPAVEKLLDELPAGAEKDLDVRLLRAQVDWHMKEYAHAADGFSAIASDGKLSAEERAQGFAGLGIVEMTCENPHLARIAFLRALRLDRKNASAWYHLGCLYRDGFGYMEAALEQFEIFVRLEEMANPRVQKVQQRVIPGLKESIARVAAERPGVSKRNSAASAAALAKAEAEVKKGNVKAARKAYQNALSSDPLSYPAALGLAKVCEKANGNKADQAEAFENYKLACVLRPSAVSTFLKTGALALRLGYGAQAVEIYSRAVAANPTSLEAIDGLIRALQKVGNRNSVVQAYQKYRDSLSVARKRK